MATGTAPKPSSPVPPPARLAECERLIDQRLEDTRRRVKGADVVLALTTVAVGALAYLLVAGVLDHWAVRVALWLDGLLLPEGTSGLARLLVGSGLFAEPAPLGSGGFDSLGRAVMWLGLVVGGVVWFVRRVLPLLVYRINPIYAAYTIEQASPSFKNSLINLLFLRRQRDEVDRDEITRRVYEGLEYRTAADLAQVPPEAAVDRSRIIHWGYVLVVLVALFCLYLVLSPKSLLASVGRVVWPWGDIDAPTRVTIRQVDPGDTTAYQGDTVIVSADIRGLAPDEPAALYFTSADRQTVNEAIPMSPAGGYRFECELPPGKSGLRQSLEYFLSAGDYRTRTFFVEVQVPLAIVVERVEYDYPAYLGKPKETVEGRGDLKAIEGTEVTIYAGANQPIDRASIELDCDPRHARRMTASGQRARASLVLRMSDQDPTQPEHTSYQLRFVDPKGRENRRPVQHRIEVIPDLRPEVRLVDPPADEVRLPRNGHLDLKVHAEDPDFGLRRVGIRAQREGKSLGVPALLDKPKPERAHPGPFEGTCRIEPAALGLQVGDKVVYWAEALDNKENAAGPAPNHAETEKRWITVVAEQEPPPEPKRPSGHPAQKPDQGQGKPDQGQGKGDQQDQGNSLARSEDQKPDPPPPGDDRAPADRQQSKPTQPEDAGNQPGQSMPQAGSKQEGKPEPKGSAGAGAEPKPSGQAKPDASENGQPGESQGDPGESSKQEPRGAAEKPQEPVNSKTRPGDAIERILEHQRRQQEKHEPQGESKPSGAENPAGQTKPAGPEKTDSGAKPSGAPKPGSAPKEPKPAGDDGPSDEPPPADPDQPAGRAGQPPQAAKPGAPKPDAGEPADGQPTETKSEAGQPDRPKPGARAEKQPAGDRAKPESTEGPSDDASPEKQEHGAECEKCKAAGGKCPEHSQGSGAKAGEKAARGKEKPEAKTDASDQGKGSRGHGKAGADQQSSPSPQEANQERTMEPKEGSPKDDSRPSPADAPDSPSISPKQSTHKSDTPGDRSAGGGKGGGQPSKQEGAGNAGSTTDAAQGGTKSDLPGDDETGTKPGDRAKAEKPTGEPGAKQPGEGAKTRPGEDGTHEVPSKDQGKPSERGAGDSPTQGDPGAKRPEQGARSATNPTAGGMPGKALPPSTSPEATAPKADDPNLEYTRQQTSLALRHLEEEANKERSDLLDRLGWTPEQAKEFIDWYRRIERASEQPGPQAEAAKRERDAWLKSLGLRPRGTELRGGTTGADKLQNLKDPGRIPPPPKWRSQFRAYTEGVGSRRE